MAQSLLNADQTVERDRFCSNSVKHEEWRAQLSTVPVHCSLWLGEVLSDNFIVVHAWDAVCPCSSRSSFPAETSACICIKLVGICCHQRQRLVITFFALTEQKEVLFCNLDGNRAASFHCCLRTGINVKLLYNQTSLNLKMPPKSPTEQSGLTLCSWTLTPKLSCDVRMQWQWHLCSVSHSYISKQQQNLFSSRSFQLSKRHFVLALENHCCHKDWAVLELLLSLHTPCTENSGVAVQGVCWWFTEMHLASDSSPNLWNNNDSSVWRGLVLLCCRVLLFTSGSLRGSFWSSRYLLQHQPANHREYTWGIELTGN